MSKEKENKYKRKGKQIQGKGKRQGTHFIINVF